MSQDPNPNTQNPPQAASQEKTAEKKRLAPPRTITNLLMYENSCFWYELSCCDSNSPHIGVLVSLGEQPITGCDQPPMAIIEEMISLEAIPFTDGIAAVSHFYGTYNLPGRNTEEPLGLKKRYFVENYGFFNNGPFVNRIVKIMKVTADDGNEIVVARILPDGKIMNEARPAQISNTTPPDPTNSRIFIADIELDPAGVPTPYEHVLILVE